MTKNKKVRALLFTLTLAFFAVGTIAIAKEVMKKENVEQVKLEPAVKLVFQTWYFTGAVDNDPENPLNYSLVQDPMKPCGFPYELICSISAPNDGTGHPNMDEEVYDEDTNQDQTILFLVNRAKTSIGTSSPELNAAVTAYRPL